MPIIPAIIPNDATPGEERLFHFFEKLSSAFHIWFNPSLGDKIADFVTYSPKNGLLVLEVKDWTLDQVVEADKFHVRFRYGWNEVIRTCPRGQSENYLNCLKALFSHPYRSGFLLPLACGVVLPNIGRAEFEARCRADSSIRELTRPETTLFREDLEELERSVDKSTAFQAFLDFRFPAAFLWTPDAETLQTVKNKLGHRAVVKTPVPDWRSGEERLIELDEAQEKEALALSGGRRLLLGSAGSGKTLVLVQRAALLMQKEKCRWILFLCFNLSLVNYLCRLLSDKAVPLGKDGVEVLPVYDLAARILGAHVEEKENADYYRTVQDLVLEELENAAHPFVGRWDAVFVDEAQDFSPMMIRMVEKLLGPATPLLVAMDADQHIYAASSPDQWMSLPGMKTAQLRKRYRSTRQIMAFAEDWLDYEELRPEESLGVLEGDMPNVLYAKNAEEAAALAANGVAALRARGMAQGQMAVLYARDRVLREGRASTVAPKRDVHCDGTVSALVAEALATRGCLSRWPAEDDRAKRRYDVTTNTVTVSTIHSMKGMDFAHVALILPVSLSQGRERSLLKSMEGRRAAWEKRRKAGHAALSEADQSRHALIYVGMTRARQSLTVIWYDDAGK